MQQKNNLYNVHVSWTMAVVLEISASSEEVAKEMAYRKHENTAGTLHGAEYCHNSFAVDHVELAERHKPSDWVVITQHPTLPCSLNSYINEGNVVEYIVEIDGNTEYHLEIGKAMEDYVRRVVHLEEKREVQI